jgi:hypothetical protein
VLNNGIPQGSVLAPILFNVYVHDMPDTVSKKFAYADDTCIVLQSKHFEDVEDTLTSDLTLLEIFFKKWRLRPNPSKTMVTAFHLNNKEANRELTVHFCGETIRNSKLPVYLGITLDRALTFKAHLQKVAAKIKTRNSLINKLAGTSWGSSTHVLRTSTLALTYSVAEYCAPVWEGSQHCSLIDVQLRKAMRKITGTVMCTNNQWLPVLANIEPPHLRRQNCVLREKEKIDKYLDLPIHEDGLENPRLKSRKPFVMRANEIADTRKLIPDAWQEEWARKKPGEGAHLESARNLIAGMNQPRKIWTRLNRARTRQGRCKDLMYKWKLVDDPNCDCGEGVQSMSHIIEECPLRKYDGDPKDFLVVTPGAVAWLEKLDIDL